MCILRTQRLDLLPASPETLELLIAGEYRRAGDRLGVLIPDGWPNEQEAVDGLAWHVRALREDLAARLWHVRLIVLRAEGRVIGSINLKGAPDYDGTIEIGWGVTAEYRRQGIASEATGAVIEWAMTDPRVQRVVATIPRGNEASQGVARRVGMSATQERRRGLPVWELRADS
jgi:RimJ/RimL family protein N-acetyltransferase